VQTQARVSYSFNENVAVSLGHRVLVDNYEDGNVKFDARLYGPMLGLAFGF
jgi:hypothetical protein